MKRILKILYKYWMSFASFVGHVNSKIIFTLLFIVVFGVYALVIRFFSIFKRQPIYKVSYWQKKKYIEPTIENLRRQF